MDNISFPFIKYLKNKGCKIFIDIGHDFYFKNMSDNEILEQLSIGYEIVQINQKVYNYLGNRFHGQKVSEIINAKVINVTLSSKGNDFIIDDNKMHYNVNEIKKVIDETGAGDGYFSKLIDLYVKNDLKFDKSYPNICNQYVSNILKLFGATSHIRRMVMVKEKKDKCTCQDIEIKEKRKINRCFLNVNNMINRILKAVENVNEEKFNEYLKKFESSNTLVSGSGGSYASAIFISHYLNTHYNSNTQAIYPRELTLRNNNNIDNLICVSYSGTTQDMVYAIDNSNIKNTYIITKGQSKKVLEKSSQSNVISYYGSNNKGKERGFLSFEGTLSPCTIFMKKYFNDNNIEIETFLNTRFNYWKNYLQENITYVSKGMKINIMYDYNSASAAYDSESKFIESGYFNVVLSEKKNFSHGRFINYEFEQPELTIYFKTKNTSDYEDALKDYLKSYLLIESEYDGILGEYDLLIASQLITYVFAKILKVDLAKPDYSEEAMKLYFYKGHL